MVYFSIGIHPDRESEERVFVRNGPRVESEPLQVSQVLTDRADGIKSANAAVQLERVGKSRWRRQRGYRMRSNQSWEASMERVQGCDIGVRALDSYTAGGPRSETGQLDA